MNRREFLIASAALCATTFLTRGQTTQPKRDQRYKISAADWMMPVDFQAVGGKGFEDSRFIPASVVMRTAKLGPVGGAASDARSSGVSGIPASSAAARSPSRKAMAHLGSMPIA